MEQVAKSGSLRSPFEQKGKHGSILAVLGTTAVLLIGAGVVRAISWGQGYRTGHHEAATRNSETDES